MNNPLLSITGVAKRFGEVEALTHVDLTINSGQVIGLVGGNGAGKTTLLRLIAGVMEPTVGTILFEGKQVSTMRSKLGVVPESTGLYSRLTAWENIRYHSRMYGIPDDIAWNRVSHFAKRLELTESLSRHTKGFSRGMRQKTALLRALAHGPDILLLDEPTASLDPDVGDYIRTYIESFASEKGTTILLASHNMNEVERLCNEVMMMKNGSIIDSGTCSDLINKHGRKNLEETFLKIVRE